ncbi:MAG: T6SS immunity protein Tdi1 domain-containing protein [Cyanobacteria bacterium J06635_15]
MTKPSEQAIQDCLPYWSWLVPTDATPLFLSAFGDWVFGHPDGSLFVLSLLEGAYEKVANNADEFNQLNKSSEWREEIFIAGWFPIALENGIVPDLNECIGWKNHPILGGEFSVDNLQIFDMHVYQSLMSQLHAQLQNSK